MAGTYLQKTRASAWMTPRSTAPPFRTAIRDSDQKREHYPAQMHTPTSSPEAHVGICVCRVCFESIPGTNPEMLKRCISLVPRTLSNDDFLKLEALRCCLSCRIYEAQVLSLESSPEPGDHKTAEFLKEMKSLMGRLEILACLKSPLRSRVCRSRELANPDFGCRVAWAGAVAELVLVKT
ncbi:hypothetical protein K438DRAFT_1781798 [Mycena galopus ATCC 62051]|nr:hypothetical protein K438DRAFT_1786581 [Mycena galopus ATCC 62051]KAF8145576.1 hypothetical protein K438DRAFT_1781798 [Mycena galopus ATCC 62051]